jgi:hypothetical protein
MPAVRTLILIADAVAVTTAATSQKVAVVVSGEIYSSVTTYMAAWSNAAIIVVTSGLNSVIWKTVITYLTAGTPVVMNRGMIPGSQVRMLAVL